MSGKSIFHLVSDATGATLQGLAEAALSQFAMSSALVSQKLWPQVRTKGQLDRVIADLKRHPGPVIYTLVDKELILSLEEVK